MAAGLGFKTFNTGDVLSAADTNGYLMQGVLVFTNATARDAAITSPQEGQFAFTKDNDSLWYYSGSAWVSSGATGDIEGVTAGVGISGGGTSGTVTVTNSMATAIDAKGDLVVGTGADTFAKLTVGANDTILTADSTTATGLKWAAAAGGGGMTLIQEQTASGNSSLSFTSIAGTYKQLFLVWSGIYNSATGSDFAIRFNNDSSTQYRGNAIVAQGTTVSGRSLNETAVMATGGANFAPFGVSADLNSTDFNLAAVGTLLVDNYASSTKVKTYFTQFGYYNNDAAVYSSAQFNGTFNTTTAITSIDVVRLRGSATFSNITNSSIRLYGIS
jgi:hypothetical protein